jgi:hypothetical protein
MTSPEPRPRARIMKLGPKRLLNAMGFGNGFGFIAGSRFTKATREMLSVHAATLF